MPFKCHWGTEDFCCVEWLFWIFSAVVAGNRTYHFTLPNGRVKWFGLEIYVLLATSMHLGRTPCWFCFHDLWHWPNFRGGDSHLWQTSWLSWSLLFFYYIVFYFFKIHIHTYIYIYIYIFARWVPKSYELFLLHESAWCIASPHWVLHVAAWMF